jgi:hypothetical protein
MGGSGFGCAQLRAFSTGAPRRSHGWVLIGAITKELTGRGNIQSPC